MSDFVFNISRGRTNEYHERVNNNDPAPSALIVILLAEAGLQADDVLQDYDDMATLLAASNNEPTNAGYVRQTLTDTSIGPRVVDDSLNRSVISWTSSLTYTTPAAGDAWRKLIVAYDPDTGVAGDGTLIPVTAHDLLLNGAAIIPTGVNIVIANPTGYVVAGP